MRETEEAIKDFGGRVLGYVITMENGDQKVTDFGKRILGYYRKQYDHTTDFYGRVISKGNTAIAFIYNNNR